MSNHKKKPRRTIDQNFIDGAVKLGSPTSDKTRVEQLESENRQLRKQLRQAELECEILQKASEDFAKESQ
jgi:transposase-like protein